MFIFFCASCGASLSMPPRRKSSVALTYSLRTSGPGVKLTMLSGEDASNPKIAVLAMLAAIVMHSVPAGERRLCFSPNSEYEDW